MEVSAAITLEEEVFDKELENKSSARYQEMEKKVEQEVTINSCTYLCTGTQNE